MSKKVDEKVMKLRQELLKKKAFLLGSDKPVYVAGEYFRNDISSTYGEFRVSIASENQLLMGIKSILLHESAADTLNMSETHLGFSVDEWIQDFKTRKSVLDRVKNLSKVTQIEAKLKELLSQAQLREIGINDIANKISSL